MLVEKETFYFALAYFNLICTNYYLDNNSLSFLVNSTGSFGITP